MLKIWPKICSSLHKCHHHHSMLKILINFNAYYEENKFSTTLNTEWHFPSTTLQMYQQLYAKVLQINIIFNLFWFVTFFIYIFHINISLCLWDVRNGLRVMIFYVILFKKVSEEFANVAKWVLKRICNGFSSRILNFWWQLERRSF